MAATNENEIRYIQAVHFAAMIHKVREKQPLTAQEQQDLDIWLNANGSKELYESLLDRALLVSELNVLQQQYNEDNAVSSIFNAIGEQLPSAIKMRTSTWSRIAIAASLLLIAGAALWMIVKQDSNPTNNIALQPEPGKVMLTLADGKQVMLDTFNTVSLGKQGAARVQQQKGHLFYTAEGEGAVAYNTITTPAGMQYHLRLADSSEIWLNAGSSVTYPTSFVGNTREVAMTGEAYFRVAKDTAKPFFVMANTMKVQVVGTEFDIMAYTDENAIRATLFHGIIKAGNTQQGQAPSLLLKPGQQAALYQQSGVVQVERPDLDSVVSWRYARMRFKETDMTAIMRQITRWYNIKVEYRGSVAGIKFTGNFSRKDNMEDLLAILSDTRNVHFERKDSTTIVVIPGAK